MRSLLRRRAQATNFMYRIILVPVDGSPAATAGLDEAIKIAKQ
jgi:nucleotide-binding universal stress UspA family protein